MFRVINENSQLMCRLLDCIKFKVNTTSNKTTSTLEQDVKYSVRVHENTDQNNSEYGHFLRGVNKFCETFIS